MGASERYRAGAVAGRARAPAGTLYRQACTEWGRRLFPPSSQVFRSASGARQGCTTSRGAQAHSRQARDRRRGRLPVQDEGAQARRHLSLHQPLLHGGLCEWWAGGGGRRSEGGTGEAQQVTTRAQGNPILPTGRRPRPAPPRRQAARTCSAAPSTRSSWRSSADSASCRGRLAVTTSRATASAASHSSLTSDSTALLGAGGRAVG